MAEPLKVQGAAADSLVVAELEEPVEPPQVPESNIGVAVALALIAAIVISDLALGDGPQVVGLLALPACLAAIFVGPRRTLLVAVAQTCAGIGLAFLQGVGTDLPQIIRMGGVVLGGAVAFALSSVRTELDQRLRAVSQIALRIQSAVLRPIPSVVGPIDVEVRYVSATAEARVGGDFYEVLPFAGGVRLVVGDVRGKGIGAVRLASVLVGAFRAADHDCWSLEHVLASMDAAFHRVEPDEEDFATVVLAEISDEHELVLLNCGHPPPLLIGKHSFDELGAGPYSPPIGLGPHAIPLRMTLESGARLLLYTDGLVEGRRGARTFDPAMSAVNMGTGALSHAVDRLRTDLVRFVGGHLDDDTTLLLAQLSTSNDPPLGKLNGGLPTGR